MSHPTIATPSSKRDPALDGLRGVAIAFVFLFHYGGGATARHPVLRAAGYLTQAGWVGVELFFVLSGFLITGLLLDNLGTPHHLRNFFARRALRILPLYWAALLMCGGAALILGARPGQLRPLLIYLAFLQNLPSLAQPALHTPPPLPLFHLWSLAVEEQFYLIWPWLVVVARTPRRVLWCALAAFAGSLLCRLGLFTAAAGSAPADTMLLVTLLPVRLGALALGGALAAARRARFAALPAAPAGWLAVAAGSLFLLQGWRAGSLLLASPASLDSGLFYADLLCAAVLALALRQTAWRRLLQKAPLVFLGRISYGVYVFHILLEPVFDALSRGLLHRDTGFLYQGVRLVVAFGITLAISTASFWWLERPWLRLKAHFPEQRSVKATEPLLGTDLTSAP